MQDRLAGRIGLERPTVQRYECGERDPRFTGLLLIADALGAPLADLVQGCPRQIGRCTAANTITT
ncbi:helix-turn-helix domain-containing protein [Streptomyces sp. NPDC097727]|uniref:helix-turn-helix domain-containing protein n=1 Tax=Streptomyces sp. NPDC097727 TaxID=3366092 RepID=UPI00381C4704